MIQTNMRFKSERANGTMVAMEKQREKGFTLVELTLAMSFLAFIMVFVVIVLLQIMNIYNKGLAMTQINQTGRQLSDDINSSIRFAQPSTVTYLSASNRLCTGDVSYLWNVNGGTTNSFGDTTTELGVVRVKDSVSAYCSNTSLKPNIADSKVSVLAGPSVSVLGFTVSKSPSFVKILAVLSTSGNNKPVLSGSNWTCLGSGGGTTSNPYCAFATFDNTIYMRGGQ